MTSIWFREFTGGLDTRRLPVATSGGVLIEATDGHVTRGGEFEQRAAFVEKYTLPAGTRGMLATRTGLVVFGHDVAPAMPIGVTYQRLEHPSGQSLSRVLSTDLYAGKIYAVGEFGDGSVHHYYDGVHVDNWFDGRARGFFRVLEGAGGGSLTDLTVSSVPIIGAPVAWSGTTQSTASDIAAAINAHVSTPDYNATASGDVVNIVAFDPGVDANERVVSIATNIDLTLSTGGFTLQGGAEDTGTFTPGRFVRTFGSKMYCASGPNVHFSGIQQPTVWTTDAIGAGFIDMSREASGFEDLTALVQYQNLIAIFAENAVQTWFFDSDPDNNKQSQVLSNTGTISPRSVTQFGDADIFYLAASGLRSLRARDSSNAAATTDIGVPVDDLIKEAVADLNALESEQYVFGLIEPADGRFWLIIAFEIFVFSYFQGAKVSAWSRYHCHDTDGVEFVVDGTAVYQRRIYLRSGDRILVYGGDGARPVYDDTVAIARLPYLDASKPAQLKRLQGLDVAASGTWEIFAAMDPNNLAAMDQIAVTVDSTFNAGRIQTDGWPTHVSLIFRSQAGPSPDKPARLASALIHFEADDNSD